MEIKTKHVFAFVTFLIFLVCYGSRPFYYGFHYDDDVTKYILLYDFIMVILVYIIGEPIYFLAMAFDRAMWPPKHPKIDIVNNVKIHERIDYLKLRIAILKNQVKETLEHRNEFLNSKYQLIAIDVSLYGRYFIVLTCVVLVTRTDLLYYNNVMKLEAIYRNHTRSFGISAVKNIDQMYYFIETELIDAFSNPYDAQSKWDEAPQNKRLGAVRLRQLRRPDDAYIGWGPQEFTKEEFATNWQRPFEKDPYADKKWVIYAPWLPAFTDISQFQKSMAPTSHGYFQNYPKLEGYVVMLSRNANNSKKILNYLKRNNWLDKKTAVLFMDFTMYSPDSSIFTVCKLQIEQTPHGQIVGNARIESVKVDYFDVLGVEGLICCCLYFIVFIQFSSTLVVTLWFEPRKIRHLWNIVDVIILILNIMVIGSVFWLVSMIKSLLNQVQDAHITNYLDFSIPILARDWGTILLGFLVCLTTLRLWKVLQFARVFQLMTAALYTALPAVASSSLVLVVIVTAFSIVTVITNGNNSKNLFAIFPGIFSTLRNCFGYTEKNDRKDYTHGGLFLTLIFNLIMAFLISNMLINVFISLLSHYFVETKYNMDTTYRKKITFMEFLKVEYANFFQCFKKLPCIHKSYHRHDLTVAQNIKRKLDYSERLKIGRLPNQAIFKRPEAIKHAEYKRGIEKMLTLSQVLETQMELLEFMLFSDQSFDSSDEYVDEQEYS